MTDVCMVCGEPAATAILCASPKSAFTLILCSLHDDVTIVAAKPLIGEHPVAA